MNVYENHTLGTLRKEIDRLIAEHGENTYTDIPTDGVGRRYEPQFHIQFVGDSEDIGWAKGYKVGLEEGYKEGERQGYDQGCRENSA